MSPSKSKENYQNLYNLFNKQINEVKEKYPVVYLFFNILNQATAQKDKWYEILTDLTPPLPFPLQQLPPDCFGPWRFQP